MPESNLIELPETVSYEEAAMLEPMAVACHALRRVGASYQDTVAVCGLGTIGMLMRHAFIGTECEGSPCNWKQGIPKTNDFKAWHQRRTVFVTSGRKMWMHGWIKDRRNQG